MTSTPLKEKIRKYFKDIGFYEMTPGERVKKNQEAFEYLQSIPKDDYNGVKQTLRIIGGRIK